MADINKNTLTVFLPLFKDASDKMEGSSKPTLHLVLLWRQDLLNYLEPDTADDDFFLRLRYRATHFLQKKLEIHKLHKVCTFLHPPLKSLCSLEEEEVEAMHNEVRKMTASK